MNIAHAKSDQTTSAAIYQRCVWSLSVGGIVAAFFFSSWMTIQRVKVSKAEVRQHEAEQELADTQRRHADEIKNLNEQIAKAQAGRFAAEKEARKIAANVGQSNAAADRIDKAMSPQAKGMVSEPNAQELEAFIKAHLFRMMQSAEVQVEDYADAVEFHDKARASKAMIENERKQMNQKFPVRVIFKDEIQPRFAAARDAEYGWVAEAVFDFRWEYRSRTGAVLRGVTRDTWKIVPTVQGLKIIAEHSADPVTGQSRD